MLQQFIEEFPQLQIAQKIRALILKTLVSPVGRFPLLERPLARVLHAQGGSDDQHFAQAVLFLAAKIMRAIFGSMGNFAIRQPMPVSALLSSTAPSSASNW